MSTPQEQIGAKLLALVTQRDNIKLNGAVLVNGEWEAVHNIANDALLFLASSSTPGGASRPQTDDWQPIASAPKDGTRLLLYGCEYRRHWFGHGYYFKGVPGDGEGWIAHSFYTLPNNDSSGVFQPTHWRPLPSPPQETGC